LGDSILNFVIAEALFNKFPSAKEGKLSRLRAGLVKGVTLALVARHFDLGEFLVLGSGELKSGGHQRDSILADTVEAIIGAIFLDSGFEAAKERVLFWYAERLDAIRLDDPLKDPKTRLQEHQQAQQLKLPVYKVIQVTGPTNEQEFTVSCQLVQLDEEVVSKGNSRRTAEQVAAEKALKLLGQLDGDNS
ncbi:MAG: ribonuclease III, partial [Oleibacter sp.]|nr:ribonuclease III [Thalassolituus sp.]